MAERFPNLSESDLKFLIDQKSSENTKKATKVSHSVLREYLKERGIEEEPLVSTKKELAVVLRKFYAEVRKKNGELYSKSSLVGIRCGLQRYFSTYKMDIIKDPEFSEANAVYQAEISEIKREGKAQTQHKPPINKEDIKKLYESGLFSLTQPDTLQNKVFFEVMIFFCRRGRQNLRELKKEDFSIRTDSSGVRYVCKVKDELTKNRRENDEAQESQTMFETGGPLCPVLSFEKYVSRLNPKNEFLFQRHKKAVDESDEVWYDNMVVGERTLGDKMKKLSIAAKLSFVYTNHSIRATAITILDECGYEARHIMALSGHKSESSIRSYASQTSLSTNWKMSETLAESLNKKTVTAIVPATSVVGRTSDTERATSQEPLLTASQEAYILNELSVEQSNTQQTVNNNFYNCTFNF
ncbi:uncharacterized protein KIAA1958-like [Oculina patagonica]